MVHLNDCGRVTNHFWKHSTSDRVQLAPPQGSTKLSNHIAQQIGFEDSARPIQAMSSGGVAGIGQVQQRHASDDRKPSQRRHAHWLVFGISSGCLHFDETGQATRVECGLHVPSITASWRSRQPSGTCGAIPLRSSRWLGRT